MPAGTLLQERLALFGLAQAIRPRLSLEIGSWCGGSLVFLAYCSERTVSVDPNLVVNGVTDSYSRRIQFCSACGVQERIEHVKATSDDYFVACRKVFDLIHIDGNHDYEFARRDLVNSLRHLSARGVIALHDACRPSVQAAIRDVVGWRHQTLLIGSRPALALVQAGTRHVRHPLVKLALAPLPTAAISRLRRLRARLSASEG